jgi:hypothetical protein
MSIISHVVTTTPQSSTRLNAVYTFTDHVGETVVVNKLVANAFDTDADALSMYARIEVQQAEQEVSEQFSVAERWLNPDKVPVYQTQPDFDRRLLGQLMTVEDVHVFSAGLPFFQAVESRGGANAGQRATYLGVILAEYDLVDGRFSDSQGVQFFIDDEKENRWEDIPEDWN